MQAEGELIRSINILANCMNDNSNSTNNIETWAKGIMMNGFDVRFFYFILFLVLSHISGLER